MPPDPRSPLAVRRNASVGRLVAMLRAGGERGRSRRQERQRCTGLEPGPQRTVARIIDGETVALDDGSELRLIGALAPRALDAGVESGHGRWKRPRARRSRVLVLGKSIELGFSSERDRPLRPAAGACLLIEGEQRRWVQGHLLEQGLARAYVQAGNRACARELLAAERAAPARLVPACGRRPPTLSARADDPAELLRYHARFQIVEGRVARVAQVRGFIYLNFGSYPAACVLRLAAASTTAPCSAAMPATPRRLEGRIVRVRGWIERRRDRPAIDLSAAGHDRGIEPAWRRATAPVAHQPYFTQQSA